MELRTLKEIEHPAGRFADCDVEEYKAILKQEAIKWINNWLKVLGNPKFLIDENYSIGFRKEEMDRFNMTQCEACASIGAFVNFFNIAEEDLKLAENRRKE